MLSHKITTSRNCILGLLLGFFSLNTFAGNLNLELPATDLTLPALKKSYDIQLGIQDEKYSATPTELNGYNNFTDAKLRAKGQTLWSASRAYIDVGGTYSANISSFGTVYVPEAFYSYSGSSFEMTLGRRLFAWNELDSYWQLGLWQTSFKWNYVQPVEQGLTGLYFDLHSTEFKFLVFASPLFIPEQSAPFSLSNGQINSQSPWFTPPAKYVQLFSGRANINYNLMTPPTSSIVSQFSGGMAFQWAPKPFSLKLSYVYKPRNTLSLPVDGYLALQPGGSSAPVFIYPKVVFHHLAGLDINYQAKDISVWFSALGEIQNNPAYDSNLTYQTLSNQILLSPGFEWLPFSSPNSTKVGASVLLQSGGDVSEVGTLASAGTNIFSYPINFRQASQIRLTQPVVKSGDQQLDFNLKWIEELHDQSSLLMVELNYQYAFANLFLGADLMGSGASSSNSGFIPRFRDNSFAYAGANFHF